MLKFFVKDFSGTINARSLKLGILNYDDNIYFVRGNRLSDFTCLSVPSFFFLSIWTIVKFFVKVYSGTIKAKKSQTWYAVQ